MAIKYSFTTDPGYAHGGELKFFTDSDRMFNLAFDFILVLVDAMKWRNRVEDESNTKVI